MAALVVGQALYVVSRGGTPARPSPLAAPLGIAGLLVACGIAARLPGGGTTVLIAALLTSVLAAIYLWGRVDAGGGRRPMLLASAVVAITIAAASLPFAIAGNIGVLGAGLVNDDMASHLLIADFVQNPDHEQPSFVRSGYPTGPHGIAVALDEGLGVGLVEAFAALTLALAPLTGLLALALLRGLGPTRRVLGACLVAFSYLGAAYLAQGAFKEPLQALLLIGFAVTLGDLIGLRTGGVVASGSTTHPLLRAIPLGVLAAASVFNYSLPGLLWIAAIAVAVVAVRFLDVPRPALDRAALRRLAPYAAGAFVVIVVATIPEWSKIGDFARLDALNPDRFGSDLGNLKGPINPLEALGIWPTGDYRTSAEAAGMPAAVFWLAGAFAAAAVTLGAVSVLRRRDGLPLLAAFVAIAAVWALTALASTPYIAAKALAIAAPAAMALALLGLLTPRDRHSPPTGKSMTHPRGITEFVRLAATATFVGLAALSSFLVLRQAPVAPEAHAAELAEIRPIVEDEPVLFLGRDDFIAWELRGSGPITGVVTNYYSVEELRGRFGGDKFDVDAVFPETLDQFRYVLTTTGGPQSSPPPRFVPVAETESYVLYERRGPTGRRRTLDEGTEPGAILDCDDQSETVRGKGTAVVWETSPVVTGERALALTPGRWLISLAYDSRRPLTVSAPELGLEAELPANLDFRGPTPTFPVGEARIERADEYEFSIQVEEPNALARLLRAPNEAHLRQLTATPIDTIGRIPRRQACGQYVDWYR